jgi:hypothetical protein
VTQRRESPRQQLDEELLRFHAGKSDIRKLSELESAVHEALASELDSQRRLRKALTDLEAAAGTILRSKDMETRKGGVFILQDALLDY